MAIEGTIGDEAAVRCLIAAFMAEYVHVIDVGRLEEWPEFFTDDAKYRICTRENFDLELPLSVLSCFGKGMFRDRISALRNANVFEPHFYNHVTGAIRIVDRKADQIRTESNFQVVRTMVDGGMSLYACGRALDTFVVQSGALKLSERTVILDSRQIDTLLVIPL